MLLCSNWHVNLFFPPNESVMMGTSIDLNRCVSMLLGKLDANNQGHKKGSGCNSVKIYVCIQTRTKVEPKQNRKTVGYTPVLGDWMTVCCFSFPFIWATVQLKKPNKDSAVQIILRIVLKHHTCQVIKADRAAGSWMCSVFPTPPPPSWTTQLRATLGE